MIKNIAREIVQQGGRVFYTGGYVRDYLINGSFVDDTDIDIEVFHMEQEKLLSILSRHGKTKTVGKIYPVIKITGFPQWDFSVAPYDHYKQAAFRRDFTVNALMMDVISAEILDYTGGRNGITNKVIHHTTEQVFTEDPLRAYRAASLAARLEFTIHPETQKLMNKTDLSAVPAERIYGELKKILLLSSKPSIGLRYLEKTGILKQMHPGLHMLIGCPQEPEHHPEGDVWEHTMQVTDMAARLRLKAKNPVALMWSALLHDIGKPQTTEKRKGKITAYGHDLQGAKLAASFLHNLQCSKNLIQEVQSLVREHMHPVLLYKQKDRVSDKAIRKLVNRVDLMELLLLSEADFLGRSVERDYSEIRRWFLEKTSHLGLRPGQKLAPLVMGRDLVELGMVPGQNFKKILDDAFEWQLEGLSKPEIIQKIKAYY